MAVKEPSSKKKLPKKNNSMGDYQQKFYKTGAGNALFLTPKIKQCLSIIYSPEMQNGGALRVLSRFGNKNRFN